MHRRPVIIAAAAADAVAGVAVFLPWAGVSGNPATVAGWGTAATPRLLGLFVLACVATALSFRCGVLVAGDERVGPHVVASVLDGLAAILALVVVTGAGSFVGTNQPASPRPGSLLALAAAAVGVAAGVIAVATAGRPAATAPD